MRPALLKPGGGAVNAASGTLVALVVASGLAALLALSRTGIRFFWTPVDRGAPVLRMAEYLPIAVLVGLCVLLTVRAEALMRYASATSAALYDPSDYIGAVMSARPRPTPTNTDRLPAPVPGVTP